MDVDVQTVMVDGVVGAPPATCLTLRASDAVKLAIAVPCVADDEDEGGAEGVVDDEDGAIDRIPCSDGGMLPHWRNDEVKGVHMLQPADRVLLRLHSTWGDMVVLLLLRDGA